MKYLGMTEEFLHYLWKFKLLKGEFVLSSGEYVEIINPGLHNSDAGPDFFNAKIKIGATLWAGNVEIHVKASDWYLHQHQNDNAYDTVVLHVVYLNDAKIQRKNNEIIPCIEVSNAYDEELYHRYQDFLSNKNWIPCERLFKNSTHFIVETWLERLLIERVEHKVQEIHVKLKLTQHNWESCFYQLLAKNFGFKLNALPFELLANSLPLHILVKHKNSDFQLAALLFGQAGLLNYEYKDHYPQILLSEYQFLSKKYKLHPISGHLWKFLRLHPNNFPTIRISQFVNLIFQSQHLFSKIIEVKKIEDIYQLFQISANTYFDNHYLFDEENSIIKPKIIGKSSIDLLIINTIVPLLFCYALEKDEKDYQERALNFLEQIKPEYNSIIKKWVSIGWNVDNAFQSQALLELKNKYCDFKKCLQCRIGNDLLQNNAII